MPLTSTVSSDLFRIRRVIARVGETDAMGWWESYALGPTGDFVVPRLFPRTATLSAAHVAIATARRRQDAAVPREPLVHLFNLGEELEGEFDRWLIDRKVEGWAPEDLEPVSDLTSLEVALQLLEIPSPAQAPVVNGHAIALGTIPATTLQDGPTLLKHARALAAGYVACDRNRLVVPYFRLER